MSDTPLSVLVIAAHPDDIEFAMMGTALLLKEVGAELHFLNIANGSMGTVSHSYDEIKRLRWEEAQESAREAGAVMYPPIVDDLAIMYDTNLLARVSAVVRTAKPTIVLTHSPVDYMEDHTNACRLAVTATFARGMPNFTTIPPVAPYSYDVAIYHAMPHGLRDPLRRRIHAGQYVDVTSVMARKRDLLAKHRTQKEWLDKSQGMDSYILEMEAMNRQVGEMSGRFEYAEGWRRHLHLGFGAAGYDPLTALLGNKCWVDEDYEAGLDK
ncbi:MAG: LmbE family protein [Chloroflexi bacterium]|nr:MAG: LmbE family protein [Chloroflexota bacterium]